MTVAFELDGQRFVGLNGGPRFPFTEAVSFVVNCTTQDEIDHYWERLSDGGELGRCGWVKDRFGLWWQVVPTELATLMSGPDRASCTRVMTTMLEMGKLDVGALRTAHAGDEEPS